MSDELKAGYQVFSSCRAEIAGEILWVGQDEGGESVVDLYVADLGEFVNGRWQDQRTEWSKEHPELMQVYMPHEYKNGRTMERNNLPTIFKDLQYNDEGDNYFTFNTPGSGCYRCQSLFWIRKPGDEEYDPDYAKEMKS